MTDKRVDQLYVLLSAMADTPPDCALSSEELAHQHHAFIQRLKDVNQALWQIEDDIRDQERQKSFSESFIALARSVYQQNDQRAAIKKEINTTYGSAFAEEKSYQEY